MILLSGSSNIPLAQKIAESMGMSLGAIEISTFTNGELRVWVKEEVKGKDVALVQSFSDPVDSAIVETALITDALFRAGARRVFAVIPWLGYSLQDKVFRPGEPIAAKVVATLLGSTSIYRYILMHLHNSSIAGFFDKPSSVLSANEIFEREIRALGPDVVLVSSDFGALKHVGHLSERLSLPYASIDKRRDLSVGTVTAKSLAGDVTGKNVVIVDDCINGGLTAVEAARFLKEKGAKSVRMMVTHGILAGDASQKLQESDLDEVIVTDTINTESKNFAKLRVVSVADVFAAELSAWM